MICLVAHVPNAALAAQLHCRGNESLKIPRLLGLAVLFSVLLVLSACGSSSSSEPDNFKNIKWGAQVGTISGLEQIAEEGDLRLFEKKDDDLKAGAVNLDKIIYGFYKGRFYTAMVYFPAASFDAMKEYLAGQFGQPQPLQPGGDKGKCLWDGPNVTMFVVADTGSGSGRLSYMYKPLQLESELKK